MAIDMLNASVPLSNVLGQDTSESDSDPWPPASSILHKATSLPGAPLLATQGLVSWRTVQGLIDGNLRHAASEEYWPG